MIKKLRALTTVALIIVGIVVEAITNHATIDAEKKCKPARADLYDTLTTVTADFETTLLTLKGSIVLIGTDVSIYVTEGHIIKVVRETIDTPYSKVTESTLKLSCSVAVNEKEGCEGTVSGEHTVGTGPLNAGSGTVYLTVYISGVAHDILYGAVRVTTSLTATEHNVDRIGEKHCETVCVTGAKGADETLADEHCKVVTDVA